MANQRAQGKKLIGAMASPELLEAVDKWLRRNPAKTVTDFITEACIEKLQADGIHVDLVAALRDRRGRLPAPGPTESNVNYKGKPKVLDRRGFPLSSKEVSLLEAGEAAALEVTGLRPKSSPSPATDVPSARKPRRASGTVRRSGNKPLAPAVAPK